jgi:hypothetical protein
VSSMAHDMEGQPHSTEDYDNSMFESTIGETSTVEEALSEDTYWSKFQEMLNQEDFGLDSDYAETQLNDKLSPDTLPASQNTAAAFEPLSAPQVQQPSQTTDMDTHTQTPFLSEDLSFMSSSESTTCAESFDGTSTYPESSHATTVEGVLSGSNGLSQHAQHTVSPAKFMAKYESRVLALRADPAAENGRSLPSYLIGISLELAIKHRLTNVYPQISYTTPPNRRDTHHSLSPNENDACDEQAAHFSAGTPVELADQILSRNEVQERTNDDVPGTAFSIVDGPNVHTGCILSSFSDDVEERFLHVITNQMRLDEERTIQYRLLHMKRTIIAFYNDNASGPMGQPPSVLAELINGVLTDRSTQELNVQVIGIAEKVDCAYFAAGWRQKTAATPEAPNLQFEKGLDSMTSYSAPTMPASTICVTRPPKRTHAAAATVSMPTPSKRRRQTEPVSRSTYNVSESQKSQPRSQTTTYWCWCKKSHLTLKRLRKHLITHNPTRFTECPVNGCTYMSPRKDSVRNHFENIHHDFLGEGQYDSEGLEGVLLQHTFLILDRTHSNCFVCKEAFAIPQSEADCKSIQKHILKHFDDKNDLPTLKSLNHHCSDDKCGDQSHWKSSIHVQNKEQRIRAPRKRGDPDSEVGTRGGDDSDAESDDDLDDLGGHGRNRNLSTRFNGTRSQLNTQNQGKSSQVDGRPRHNAHDAINCGKSFFIDITAASFVSSPVDRFLHDCTYALDGFKTGAWRSQDVAILTGMSKMQSILTSLEVMSPPILTSTDPDIAMAPITKYSSIEPLDRAWTLRDLKLNSINLEGRISGSLSTASRRIASIRRRLLSAYPVIDEPSDDQSLLEEKMESLCIRGGSDSCTSCPFPRLKGWVGSKFRGVINRDDDDIVDSSGRIEDIDL